MSVSANVGGDALEFNFSHFDVDNSSFELADNGGLGVTFSITYPLQLDTSFVEKSFQVHFLCKKDLAENEIFQFLDATQSPPRRIGWCIPVNSLDSTEHDFATNQHFLKYAYVAIISALKVLSKDNFYKTVDLDASTKIKFTDIFHESTAFLVISEETLQGGTFCLDRLLPALATHGYFQLNNNNPSMIRFKRGSVDDVKLTLQPLSSDITNNDYIYNFYSRIIPYESNVLLQFFHLYQLLELLMEIIFMREQEKLVNDIVLVKDDINATKELLGKMGTISSEKKRMNLLTAKYSPVESSLGELRDSCNELLRHLGSGEGTSIDTYLYPIRNFLFHHYRNFPTTAEPFLDNVVNSLLDCLPIIFNRFKVTRI